MSQTEQVLDREIIATEERAVVLEQIRARLGWTDMLDEIVGRLGQRGAGAWARTVSLAHEFVSDMTEADFVEVLRVVTEVSKAAEDDFAEVRPKRDKIVLSLALYEDERGLSTQTGLSRQRVHEMKGDALYLSAQERNPGPSCTKAKIARRFCGCEGHWLNNASPDQIAQRASNPAAYVGLGPRVHPVSRVPVEFARRHLPELAEQTLRAEERKKAALLLRDALVAATDPQIWTRERLAPIIGKNVSQVTRIRKKAADAAEAVAAA